MATVTGDTTVLAEMYHDMLRIRLFEERTALLFRAGEVPGFVHLSSGQEAVAVGVCRPLRETDVITSTHRGHHHVLAKGADMTAMFAELMAREGGTCHGRGGSMHIADVGLGIFGANGIVGAGLPIATGAALAQRLRAHDGVVVAFFGDGAVAQGAFHEALTLATHLDLPVLFVCENNQYAEFQGRRRGVPLEVRAGAYGLKWRGVDGNDVEAVEQAAASCVGELRAGSAPLILEASTLRLRGHYEGDPQRYRDAEIDAAWADRDPLALAAARLGELGVPDAQVERIRAEAEAEVEAAVAAAAASPPPDPAALRLHVTAERPAAQPAPGPEGKEMVTKIALRHALRDALSDDERVFLAGIDVGPGGNVFGITRGLWDDFPERVIDTPICESGLVGMGVGAAMAGLRPVVEVMYMDFLTVCLDQLVNQAAKLRYMTGGGTEMPLTVRTQFGAGRSSGAQHSQSLEAMLAHVPGLTVVMPSTPADAYGLLRSAIDEPNPVVVVENRLLYDQIGPAPPPGHRVPIGKAHVVRPGAQATVVAVSRMVHVALEAAAVLAAEGVEVEVIDLLTVAPLDFVTIAESVERTSRLVIVHEAVTDFGIGAEIAARAADEGFWNLDAPIRRVGAAATPPPYAPGLEAAWLPDTARIVAALRDVLNP